MTNALAMPDAELTALTLSSVASSSARVYSQTYRAWAAWCSANEVDPLDLRPTNVLRFIAEQDTTKATRQRQLSALRKLAQMMFVLSPGDDHARRIHEALKVVKVPDASRNMHQERGRRALTPAQADRLLRVWDEATHREKRNAALIALLLLSGIRRSEAAALRWRDIDFTNGVISIRHGKGDKAREVPLAGEYALDALRAWQLRQPAGYTCVFTPVHKGDRIGADKPITGTDVYRIVEETGKLAGVEWHPHDARRTFITEALATGTPVQTVQAIAGHSRGDTTLHYAEAVSARQARRALRLRYGD